MTIKQLTLFGVAIIATTQATAMDRDYSGKKGPKPCPSNVRGPRGTQVTPFVNNGVMFNAGNFSHHGPFINTGSGIVVNSGTWNSGNIPQQQYPQYYPQYPYAQPPVYLPVAYAARPAYPQTSAQKPHAPSFNKQNALRHQAQNREWTPQERKMVEEMEKLEQFCGSLPKEFQVSVGTFSKLNPGEKAMVATTIIPRLEKNEKVQDLKRVMHVFSEEDKNHRLISPKSTTPTENKSLFFGEPKTHLSTIEQKTLWTPLELSPDTKAIGEKLEQLTLTWEQLDLPKIS